VAATFAVRVLGPVQVDIDGRPVVLGRRQERLLLALLALEAGRPLPVGRLVELVWGDHPPASPRRALQTYVSRLRAALGPPGTVDVPHPCVIRRADAYVLEAEPGVVDAVEFARMVDAARSIRDPAERSAHLVAALALWRGPLLADVASPELRQQVGARLLALRARALRMRIEADLAVGRHDQLVSELIELTITHPHDESLAGYLMLAQHRAGLRTEALQTFRLTRRRLSQELGIEPGQALSELHRAILRGDSAFGGETVIPAQLPAVASHFTGRAQYLSELDRRPASVTVLAGVGGIGKTALAVTWADRVRALFPDGQLYADLRGHFADPTPPIDALAGFLRALGVPGERIPVSVDEAAALYRTAVADRRLLVLLDDAADADQVRALLPGASTCLALVTSRTRLTGLTATHGAYQIALAPLSGSESLALLTNLVGPRRVDAEPDAAATLAQLCGHLPLALRIAAALLIQKPDRTIAEHVSTLERDVLGGLTVPYDDGATMKTIFDQTYLWLSDRERGMLRLLGLHPGSSVSPHAAAALADIAVEDGDRLLNRLADCHLVEPRTSGRYGLHDLVRSYAAGRALSEDGGQARDRALRRLFDWYLSMAEAAAQLLDPQRICLPRAETAETVETAETAAVEPFADTAEALSWLDIELPNLVAVAVHAAAHGPPPVAWTLADTLRGYLWQRKRVAEWLTVAEAGLQSATTEQDSIALAAVHRSLANAGLSQARYDDAITHYTSALRLSREVGWTDSERVALAGLASAHRELGQLDVATGLLHDALAAARQTGPPAAVPRQLIKLGLVNIEAGNPASAIACLREALAIDQEIGSPRTQAEAYNNLAMALHMHGHLDEALQHATTAHALAQRLGDKVGEANKLDTLAAIYRDLSLFPQALEYANAAATLAGELDDRRIHAHARNTLGSIHDRLGDPGAAADQFRAALHLAQLTHTIYAQVSGLIGLATVQTDPSEAIVVARQALRQARQAGYRLLEGQALTAIAAAHVRAGRSGRAKAFARRAMRLHRDGGHVLAEKAALAVLRRAG